MDNELRCKIMEIREETDCPINDIKEALEICGLDKDKALECLREQARIKGESDDIRRSR